MPVEIKCPECHQPLTRFSKFWMCLEHGQVSPHDDDGDETNPIQHPKFNIQHSFSHLRIFLSYGHDDNEELVRRIKADLENRGHDVWFDKNEIKFGDDWRREITDGITGSHRVLSFLSKHSTRDPGVCLDEIAIAIGVKGGNIQTILVESETEVKPPASISHIQWLDMHDWKERKQSGWRVSRQSVVGASCSESSPPQAPAKASVPPENPDPWETWYQAKLAEIIRVVESDESRRFAGEIETLSGHLKPIASDSRISTLLRKGFIGRQWLFDAIETWRNPGNAGPQTGSSEFVPDPQSSIHDLRSSIPDPQSEIPPPSRLFWITGDPGVGKSAFAAHLTHFGRDKVIAAQFVEWDKPDHRDARRVVRSLAFQLATRLPDYRKLLLTLPEIAVLDRKDPAELFDYLLANPLKTVIGGGRERLLIVIDALDEAGEAGRNPLVEMLARHAPRLPDWLGLVVTSRPESAVQTPLQGLNPFVLDTRTEANRADLRDYLHHQLAPQLQHRPDADRLLGQILEKSEGVFLYAERFCDDVQHGQLSLDRPDQFPQGLGGIFCQWFQRQFPDLETFRKNIRPALRAILAAREPLPVEILQRLFLWQDEELRDFTRTLGSLFPVTKEANGEVIKPYHKSLPDWLAEEAKAGEHFVSVVEGHRILSNCGLAEYESGLENMQNYYLQHLPAHLLLAGDKCRSRQVRQNKEFLHFRDIRFYGKRRPMHVYICSTFKDMEAERNYLIRRTFPELNRLLDPHRIDADAVDLRWGIPADITSENSGVAILDMVHEEIDRCRPFFIGLLGERYGWIPQGRNRSNIEDELDYAANNPREGKVGKFIYVRKKLSFSELPADVATDYYTPHSEFDSKMETLKERIDQLAVTQRHYGCFWDDQRKQLWGLQDFGSQVLNDLYRSALEAFGPGPQNITKIEQRLQRDYAHRLLRTFVGRKSLIDQCCAIATANNRVKLCVIGEEGVGKSALLSAVIDRLQSSTDFALVMHHAGVSARSITLRGVLESWCAQLEDWVAKPISDSMPIEDLRAEFSSCVKLACAEGGVVIALDNADWVEKLNGVGSVDWLLQPIPGNAIILMSSREPFAISSLCFINVLPFNDSETKEAIKAILLTYSKQLSSQHVEIILSKQGFSHPGILVLLLRILVTSVTHQDDLAERICNMPVNFVALCNVFFDSLEFDYGISSVQTTIKKLILSQEDKTSGNLNSANGEPEIVRQIYAVFPEHCTPPEEGLRIRFGAFRDAVQARYPQSPTASLTNECNGPSIS